MVEPAILETVFPPKLPLKAVKARTKRKIDINVYLREDEERGDVPFLVESPNLSDIQRNRRTLLYPTVYLLWDHPQFASHLPKIVTNQYVVSKLARYVSGTLMHSHSHR